MIFGIAFLYARKMGPVAVADHDDETAALLQDAVESAPAEPAAVGPVERGEQGAPERRTRLTQGHRSGRPTG